MSNCDIRTPQKSQCDSPLFLIAGRPDKKYKAMEKEVKAIIYRLGGKVVSFGTSPTNRPTPDSTSQRKSDASDHPGHVQGTGREVTASRSKYDPSCTHIIMWELRRTEKFLCACAAGKVRDMRVK